MAEREPLLPPFSVTKRPVFQQYRNVVLACIVGVLFLWTWWPSVSNVESAVVIKSYPPSEFSSLFIRGVHPTNGPSFGSTRARVNISTSNEAQVAWRVVTDCKAAIPSMTVKTSIESNELKVDIVYPTERPPCRWMQRFWLELNVSLPETMVLSTFNLKDYSSDLRWDSVNVETNFNAEVGSSDVVIWSPLHTSTVVIKTFSGDIDLNEEVKADSIYLSTQSGDIHTKSNLESKTSFEASTFSGDVRVSGQSLSADSVSVSTQSGDVKILSTVSSTNSAIVSTFSGSINLESSVKSRKFANLTSKSGDISLSGLKTGAIAIETFSGSVNFKKLESSQIVVDSFLVKTQSGDVKIGEVVNAKDSIEVHTFSGLIRATEAITTNTSSLSTTSGDIDLQATVIASTSFDASSFSGRIRTRSDLTSSSITINTKSGDINLAKATSAIANLDSGYSGSITATISGYDSVSLVSKSGDIDTNLSPRSASSNKAKIEARSGRVKAFVSDFTGWFDAKSKYSGRVKVNGQIDVVKQSKNGVEGWVGGVGVGTGKIEAVTDNGDITLAF
ncbi:hypothetical protein HDU79_011674 [Rhizoclosmatium sp. JEL0117]|nr:hypothetical protein HDU79_011674 [Rhizoclosmatium sp. JEL0117]